MTEELPVHICFLPGDETLCGLSGGGGTMPIYVHDVLDNLEVEEALMDSTCETCKSELRKDL